MPFVNEYIPKEEKQQYAEIEKYIISKVGPTGHAPASQWTIDRERNMFLSQIKSGREDWARMSWHLFSRMDQLFVIETYTVSAEGNGVSAPRVLTFRIDFIATFEKGEQYLNIKKPEDKQQLLNDLHEIFTARKGGLHSKNIEYSIVFQFGPRM